MTYDEGAPVTADESGDAPRELRVGDRVQVRSQDEILATLDERGELDSMPFMPEMLPFCGETFTVDKSAHKVCDTITSGGLRKMEGSPAVHLTGLRCDGSAHGGCQNGCLFYWKDEWLTKPGEPTTAPAGPPRATLPLLQAATRKPPGPDGEELFSCQTTELNRATEPQPFFEVDQYVRDYKSGNASLFWMLRAFLVGIFNRIQHKTTQKLPSKVWIRGGRRWPFLQGRAVGRTPTAQLDLQPGERVRIKSREEIEDTLNGDLLNRGMGFDGEMARFCGRETTVQRRVQHVIDEKTSKMAHMKTPAVVLDGLICEGAYASNCPRGWICFWREIWLERADDKGTDGQGTGDADTGLDNAAAPSAENPPSQHTDRDA